MEYTCNAAVRTIRLRKTSQVEDNCFPQQGQPVSGQAVSKRQLFINGARAAGAGSGQARVTTQLKVRLGAGVLPTRRVKFTSPIRVNLANDHSPFRSYISSYIVGYVMVTSSISCNISKKSLLLSWTSPRKSN